MKSQKTLQRMLTQMPGQNLTTEVVRQGTQNYILEMDQTTTNRKQNKEEPSHASPYGRGREEGNRTLGLAETFLKYWPFHNSTDTCSPAAYSLTSTYKQTETVSYTPYMLSFGNANVGDLYVNRRVLGGKTVFYT